MFSQRVIRLYQTIGGEEGSTPLFRGQFWEGLCQRGALNSNDLPQNNILYKTQL